MTEIGPTQPPPSSGATTPRTEGPVRGEVYRALLPMSDRTHKEKYVAIVSRDSINERGMNITVARITDEVRHREEPTAIELALGEANLTNQSWLLCHELHTIPREWLDVAATGDLNLGTVIEMERVIAYALDLDH